MTIDIIGADRCPERDAAEALRQVLMPAKLPGNLLMIVGAQCLGESVQDIDILLIGSFGRGVTFKGRHGPSRDKDVRLVNLCLALEVKDHSSTRVRFDSQRVLVHYAKQNYWSDATEQVRQQRLSLKHYLDRSGVSPPWIEGAIWLRNYEGVIPSSASNVLGSSPSAQDFFALIEGIRAPRAGDDGWYIAFAKNETVTAVQKAAAFFRPIVTPTKLDRRRLETICRKLISDQKYIDRLGQQLLIFRGRGGSGKTIHLLRLAKDLYDTGKRVLFLTFNKALVADIRRLLHLIGIQNQGFDRGIHISTAHKYFIQMFTAFGMWDAPAEGSSFPSEKYGRTKSEMLQLLSKETPETMALDPTVRDAPEVFSWDYVLVDEGQDWPEDERDLLYKCFGPTRCIVADGVDQLIRGEEACDWATSAIGASKQTVALRRAMRMKSNLCRFIRDFAEEAGGEWDQEVNEEIPGGLVTIIHGEYSRELHDRVFAQHKEHGNEPVDALFCVPPDSLASGSPLVQRLRDWGFSVWDGTSRDVRDTFPTKTEEHRVVRYESCRGLEGWTVICHSLDRFFDNKRHHAPATATELFDTPEQVAHRQAIAWTMIPLTRAIDHLVIHLDGNNAVTDICRALAARYPDFVTWEAVPEA